MVDSDQDRRLPEEVIDALIADVDRLIRQKYRHKINYTVLYMFAMEHKVNFNALCNAVREAVGE